MGARSRRKGAEGEREAAALLRPAFPDARRRACGGEARGDALGRDLEGTPGWCVQVCLAARPPIARKFAEAARAVGVNEVPLALTRATGGEWLATLSAERLVRMIHLERVCGPLDPEIGI